MSSGSVLRLERITVRRDSRVVLDDLSLDLRAQEILALVGPSGSGKTSVVRTILGLVRPERGTVRIAGELATESSRIVMTPEERNLAVVFQDLALWPHLTVRGHLAFGLDARKMPKRERDARIAKMLGRVGLAGMEARHPGELSGGERQRVAIARALVQEPRAVLLDEPLANLDVGLKRELIALFRELLTERHVPALFVTHDPREASSLGDRVAVLESGKIVQSGTLGELAAKPASPFIESFIEELRWAGKRRA